MARLSYEALLPPDTHMARLQQGVGVWHLAALPSTQPAITIVSPFSCDDLPDTKFKLKSEFMYFIYCLVFYVQICL